MVVIQQHCYKSHKLYNGTKYGIKVENFFRFGVHFYNFKFSFNICFPSVFLCNKIKIFIRFKAFNTRSSPFPQSSHPPKGVILSQLCILQKLFIQYYLTNIISKTKDLIIADKKNKRSHIFQQYRTDYNLLFNYKV